MNDLAEQAVAGLQTARRAVREHPLLSFGALGTVLAVVVVVVGGQVGAAEPTRPLTTWLGLQVSDHAPQGLVRPVLLVVAIVALVATWLGLTEFVRRRPQRADRIWRVAAAWGLPFALGPPLLDTGVYRTAATGLLQQRGLDPRIHAAQRLGDAPVVTAIAPGARGTPSSDGPLGLFLAHLAASIGAGSALGTVIVVRVVAVLAVVWCGRLVATVAETGARPVRSRSDRALSLVVLNPLVLLYLVSAAHLDAVMMALVLAALLAARQQRWTTAVVAAALAASVEPAALVAVVVLIAAHLAARRRSRWWVAFGRDTAVAAAVVTAVGFAVPGGFGWLDTAGEQFAEHTPYSVPGATAVVLHPIVASAAYDDLAVGGRAAAVLALVCVLGYLIATVRLRPVEQSLGFGLLALALCAPSLQPWYLLWGVLCLATTATGGRRLAVLALSAAGCALVPQGLPTGAGYAVTGGLLLVIGAGVLAVLPRLGWGRPAGYLPPETSRTAGRTSAR